jgi:hypothetical protein
VLEGKTRVHRAGVVKMPPLRGFRIFLRMFSTSSFPSFASVEFRARPPPVWEHTQKETKINEASVAKPFWKTAPFAGL